MQAVDEGAKIIQFLVSVLALVPLSFLSAPSPILSLYVCPHTFCAHSWVFQFHSQGTLVFTPSLLTLYFFSSFFISFTPTSPYLQILLISFIIPHLVLNITHRITLMQVESYINHFSRNATVLNHQQTQWRPSSGKQKIKPLASAQTEDGCYIAEFMGGNDSNWWLEGC